MIYLWNRITRREGDGRGEAAGVHDEAGDIYQGHNDQVLDLGRGHYVIRDWARRGESCALSNCLHGPLPYLHPHFPGWLDEL
jgi:hypothetical protein